MRPTAPHLGPLRIPRRQVPSRLVLAAVFDGRQLHPTSTSLDFCIDLSSDNRLPRYIRAESYAQQVPVSRRRYETGTRSPKSHVTSSPVPPLQETPSMEPYGDRRAILRPPTAPVVATAKTTPAIQCGKKYAPLPSQDLLENRGLAASNGVHNIKKRGPFNTMLAHFTTVRGRKRNRHQLDTEDDVIADINSKWEERKFSKRRGRASKSL